MDPPLASLSLTHVHYVRITAWLLRANLTNVEPRRPRLLPVRMAGPRTASTYTRLCDADMEQS
jgi:hypothetical protein